MGLSTARSLGQRLRDERQRRHWSQERLAEAIGTSSMSINRWEHDKVLPQARYREQLCQLFNMSTDTLFGTSAREDHQGSLHPIRNIPFLRNPLFTGREAILKDIYDHLHAKESQILAISGLGGIGKTQTVLEYAYRYRDDYRAIFWVYAETRETFTESYIALARLLRLSEAEADQHQRSVEAVKEWLSTHSHWLLILDNVEDLSLTCDFLPLEGRGQTLLTMRGQSTGTLAQRLDLKQMDMREGSLFLLRRAKLIADVTSLTEVASSLVCDAQTLCSAMDGLPLALDQAGAYIEETGCSLLDYLAFYQHRCTAVLERRGGWDSGHPQSVWATLSLSFERLEQTNAAAADLLRLFAFCYPHDIPLRALQVVSTDLGPMLSSVMVDPLALYSAVASLRCSSLVYCHAASQTVTIHYLVQIVVREMMEQQTQHLWVERAVRLISDAAYCQENVSQWLDQHQAWNPDLLVQGLLYCADLIEQWEIRSLEAARVLYITGIVLLAHQQEAKASVWLQRAHLLQEQQGEPPFPDSHLALQCYKHLLASKEQASRNTVR